MDTPRITEAGLPPDQEGSRMTTRAPVVMVDGPFGSGMEEVAALLAEKLHLPILDPMRIEEEAVEEEVRDEAWQHASEGFLGFVESWIAHLHLRPGLDRSEHRLHLERTLRDEARDGGVLFGLAPHMDWAGHPLFRLRIEASAEHCIRHLADSRGMPLDEAAILFHRMEEDRHRLMREMLEDYYEGFEDFDLVLSAEIASPEELAHHAVVAMEKARVTATAP